MSKQPAAPVKFNMLRRDEQIALFEAWLDNVGVEVSCNGAKWERVLTPMWKGRQYYRIKTVPLKPCPFATHSGTCEISEENGMVKCIEHTKWIDRKEWQERGDHG